MPHQPTHTPPPYPHPTTLHPEPGELSAGRKQPKIINSMEPSYLLKSVHVSFYQYELHITDFLTGTQMRYFQRGACIGLHNMVSSLALSQCRALSPAVPLLFPDTKDGESKEPPQVPTGMWTMSILLCGRWTSSASSSRSPGRRDAV